MWTLQQLSQRVKQAVEGVAEFRDIRVDGEVIKPFQAASGHLYFTLGALLLELLATPEVCSRSWIIRQYDHQVRGARRSASQNWAQKDTSFTWEDYVARW